MQDKKKNILKTKLIILMASVVCALFQSAAPINDRPNPGSQDPIQLHLYYRDAGQTEPLRMRVQPGETHPRNLQSIYSRNEQVNFAHMSRGEFGQVFQDVADENTILHNYEMYAFEGFKDYARGLKGYKKFILSLKDKIQNDKKFRQQTANVPGFEYSFFLWKEKSGFHDFINEEANRIYDQENFSQGTDVQELLKELRNDSSEYKAAPWAVGHEDRNNKRLHALDQINSGKGVWTTKKYAVSDSLEVLQKDFEPKLSSLEEFYGNQFQHVLHDEFIDILKKSEPIYRSKSTHVFDKELTQAVVHFAGVGVEHNAHGHCQKAMDISAFCNTVVEYIHAFELKLFGDNNPVVKYIDAFESGLQDGIRKKIGELSSPVEYVKNLAVGMLTMAGYLVKIYQDTQLQIFLTRHHPEAAQLKMLEDAQQTAQLIKIAETYYKNNSGPTMVRQGAELLTDVALDVYLSGKILNAFVKLGKIGLAQRAETVPLLKELRPRRAVSFHPAQSDELVITAEKAAKILVDNKPYSPAAEVVELTSQALIENATESCGSSNRSLRKAASAKIYNEISAFSCEEKAIIEKTIYVLENQARTLQNNLFISNELEKIQNKISTITEKNHWRSLMIDPATGNKLSSKSVIEGLAGIAAEESKMLPGPLKRDPSGAAEFIDAIGRSWDVKTPLSFAPNGRRVFNLEHILTTIQADIRSGENVILNLVRLNKEDSFALVQKINAEMNSDLIKKILVVFRNQ